MSLENYEQKNVILSETCHVLSDNVYEQRALGVTRFYRPKGNVYTDTTQNQPH